MSIYQWFEPWEALDSEGNPIDACVTLRASEQDRIATYGYRLPVDRPSISDKDLLLDFIAVHWATEVLES